MRKNEYNSLSEFTSQYIGEWNPSEGHWFGLDFSYRGVIYRLHTGCMYEDEKDALFSLYHKKEEINHNEKEYELLGQFESMNALLDNTFLNNTQFRDVIMDDDTELLGQD